MADPTVVPVVDEGLGNTSYVVDLGDGRALAVDPSRDLRALQAAAEKRGLTIAFAADTHLHADYLSGALQLAADEGATVLASAAGERHFAHTALRDGDEVDLGGRRLRALATPGHTDEHLAFLLLDADRPEGVFTGGSLIVGAAARTDLVDPARTEELARAQYHSVRRLMTLPDATAVWPTHGPGSFCSAPPGAERTSTIGQERRANALLQAADEDAFVRELLSSLGSYPPYFRELSAVNQRGSARLPARLELPLLDVETVARLRDEGAFLVDVRAIADFAAGHVPGSLSIALRDAFATWLGWLVPFGARPVVVRGAEQDPQEVAWQAAKVGYDLAGELAGGIDAWARKGWPLATTALVRPAEVDGRRVLDVRQDSEFVQGHLPGARHVELGALAGHAEVPADQLVVMCGHGERAMSGASVLEATTGRAPAVLLGGPHEWAAARRTGLATGA